MLMLVIVGVLLLASGGCSETKAPVHTQHLGAHTVIQLRSGLTVTVPTAATAVLVKFASGGVEPVNKPSDLLQFTGRSGHGYLQDVDIYSFLDAGKEPMVRGVRRWSLLAASSDGTVQVRWGLRDLRTSVVAIVVHLPGEQVGLLLRYGIESKASKAAWQDGQEVWQLLSVQGASYPPYSVSR